MEVSRASHLKKLEDPLNGWIPTGSWPNWSRVMYELYR